jgi:putative transposase
MSLWEAETLQPSWTRNHARSCSSCSYSAASENGPFSLAEIMQAIKSASAHRINQVLQRRGYVWQQESFDRVPRREESIGLKVEYVLNNPVRAGLVRLPGEYPWLWPRLDHPNPM